MRFTCHSTSDDVDEIVKSDISAKSRKSFEFSCADYGFIVIPIELSPSESSEFLVMIQHMISGLSFFTGCLEFVPMSSIPPLEGLDVCPPRYPVYIIFPSLGVMLRMFTALYLSVAHDNLTKQIAICNGNYKFAAYSYSILQEFAIDNKVIVTSHYETVKKLRVWLIDSEKVLKRIASITYDLDIPLDPGVSSALNMDNSLLVAVCVFFGLSSFAAGSSRRPAPSPLPWFRRDVLVLISRPPPWPN